MFAIIKSGSKQFCVSEGQEIFVEKLSSDMQSNYEFTKVLAIYGSKVVLGKPFVQGAKVQAKIIKQGRAKKIIVFKYKSKKKYRCKQGHRQFYTKLVIEKIIC